MKACLVYIFCFLLIACGSSDKQIHKAKKVAEPGTDGLPYRGPDHEMINNCLRTTLSYKLQVEPRDYDSIATYYFHEVRDYMDPAVRERNRKLKRLKQNMRDSLTILSDKRSKVLEGEIDILQQDMNAYHKEVIGYVFVHSFRVKEKDTLSAIFVMDQNCGYKELIKVKVISDPNPEDYIESIRSIEH